MLEQQFEPEVEEYLSLKKKSTREIYSSAFRRFLEYYRKQHGEDKGFGDYLDRIFAEFQKPPREQRRVAEIEISQFIDYMKDKKLSSNSIRLYFAAVQNLLKYKQVTVSMSFIDIPAPLEKKVNGKHEWKIDQMKEFVDAATNYRDKAIILCMFQSGLAVNEICNLNYGDVQDELENDTLPICLKLVRGKTKVEFKTFFGRDAVKYLKLYLATRGELEPEDPLFIKERMRNEDPRITTTAIQQSFSEIAENVDFVKIKENAYNPARPHSIRAAFNSRLIGKIDETLREFWMGHAIGSVAKAYLAMPTEEMRKLYMTAEEYLKIEKTSREELDEKSKAEPVAVAQQKIKALEKRIEDMYAFVHKNLDPVLDLFNEITSTPEGSELLNKIHKKRLDKESEESREK